MGAKGAGEPSLPSIGGQSRGDHRASPEPPFIDRTRRRAGEPSIEAADQRRPEDDAEAEVDRREAELYEAGYQALVDGVAGALGRQTATEAVAVTNGLAWHSACAPSVLAPGAAAAALDAYLTRVLT